jgi:hypothetical protein
MDLRERIAELASRFASDILDAVSAALDEGLEAGAPGRGATPRTDGRGRTRAEIVATGDRILAVLQGAPQGIRAEELRAQMGLSRQEILRPMALLLAGGKVKKTGAKRATVYYARGGGGEPKRRGRSRKTG